MAWLETPVSAMRVGTTDPADLAARRRRMLFAILAFSPLLVLVATRARGLLDDDLLVLYGVGVLGATTLVMLTSFGWYRDRSHGAVLPDDPPLVSCMLAVHNEVDVIARCVTSVLGSSYPRLELIVVDDASTDGTVAVLEQLASRHGFTFVPLAENVGKKRALTIAAGKASGDVFVFTDSDCVVAREAVQQCVKALLASPDVGAVSGHARALNAGTSLLTRVQDTWYDGQFGVAKAAESVFGSVTCVSGPMAAFRREAVYNYIPAWADDRFLGKEFWFATDRQLTAYVLGQERIGARLKRRYCASPFVRENHPVRRWRVEYVASARVLTNVPVSVRTVVKQQVRWKKSFIRNLFVTGGFLWRRGPLPAFLFYGHVLWVSAAPILAFRHLVWLPLQGMAWLTLVYLCGVLLKGAVWGLAFKWQNPASRRWLYRPLMSMFSALCLSWLLPYSALTLRRSVWARG